MEHHTKRTIIFSALSLILLSVTFAGGVFVGFSNRPFASRITSLVSTEPEVVGVDVDFAPFWKAWSMIDEKYPSADAVTSQERVWGAISGLVESLDDPYSVFLPPEDAKAFEETISGEFSGVGMEVGEKDDVLTVIAPLKGTPADRAGIEAGDKILKIDATITSNLSVDQAVDLIRGEKGTSVSLTILREGESEPKEIAIIRDTISVPIIETELTDERVFIIRLYSFSLNSPLLFRDALREFAEARTDKLIIDVRGNPGGYLEAAIDMASWFLPAGKPVVIEDFGSDEKARTYRSKGYDIFSDKLKLAILIDGGSASASEILAGALQEHGIGTLVGQQTFGKGSVQELIRLTPDTSLKLTIAKWLTPHGVSISEQGLTPDIVVGTMPTPDTDPVLDRAIDLLTN